MFEVCHIHLNNIHEVGCVAHGDNLHQLGQPLEFWRPRRPSEFSSTPTSVLCENYRLSRVSRRKRRTTTSKRHKMRISMRIVIFGIITASAMGQTVPSIPGGGGIPSVPPGVPTDPSALPSSGGTLPGFPPTPVPNPGSIISGLPPAPPTPTVPNSTLGPLPSVRTQLCANRSADNSNPMIPGGGGVPSGILPGGGGSPGSLIHATYADWCSEQLTPQVLQTAYGANWNCDRRDYDLKTGTCNRKTKAPPLKIKDLCGSDHPSASCQYITAMDGFESRGHSLAAFQLTQSAMQTMVEAGQNPGTNL